MKIEITEDEQEAIKKILDYAYNEEYRHCMEVLEEEGENKDPDDLADNGHIYYSYKALSELCIRLNKK